MSCAASGRVEVLQPGIGTTVQDAGRSGHRHEGIPWSGWLDAPLAHAANALVGNALDACALELRGVGTELRLDVGGVGVDPLECLQVGECLGIVIADEEREVAAWFLLDLSGSNDFVTPYVGVSAFTTYNHMLMPTAFGDPEAEYWRLINGVSQWDVAVERQVQLKGPDAGRLAQILAPRDLSKQKVGQGKYVPLCNHQGVLINDPICLKLADDLYWLSIADSNIWFWAGAIAAERGLQVEVSEPDVSPLAIQGPKAEDVVAHVCGDWVRDVKYFWFRETEIEGIGRLVNTIVGDALFAR